MKKGITKSLVAFLCAIAFVGCGGSGSSEVVADGAANVVVDTPSGSDTTSTPVTGTTVDQSVITADIPTVPQLPES
jgi:hypothetical protein